MGKSTFFGGGDSLASFGAGRVNRPLGDCIGPFGVEDSARRLSNERLRDDDDESDCTCDTWIGVDQHDDDCPVSERRAAAYRRRKALAVLARRNAGVSQGALTEAMIASTPRAAAPEAPSSDEQRRVRFEWFGRSWDSPICNMPNAWLGRTPAGRCFRCGCNFTDGDQGVSLTDVRSEISTLFHRRCFPQWMKERKLPLDLRLVVAELGDARHALYDQKRNDDRAATALFVQEQATGYEPSDDAWETPGWEEG